LQHKHSSRTEIKPAANAVKYPGEKGIDASRAATRTRIGEAGADARAQTFRPVGPLGDDVQSLAAGTCASARFSPNGREFRVWYTGMTLKCFGFVPGRRCSASSRIGIERVSRFETAVGSILAFA